MGTWGIGNYENDTVQDWLSENDGTINYEYVEPYLAQVLNEEEFIDDEESFISLAALEWMADSIENKSINEINIDELVYVQIKSILKSAKKILNFKGHSELRELWQESDEYELWLNHQNNLIDKIKLFLQKIDKKFQAPGTSWSLLDDED